MTEDQELTYAFLDARKRVCELEDLNSDLVGLLMKRHAEIQVLKEAAAETKLGLEIMSTMTQEQM